MAWFRRMGADEVAYHQKTVVGRADDHPGAALDYYGSRGETPLRWGGAGAARMALAGEVTIDWATDQAQRWITDTTTSGADPGLDLTPARTPQVPPEDERPLEERQAQAYRRVRDLEDDLHDLQAGTGRWQHTPVGAAARRRNVAHNALDDAHRRVANPHLRRRERRHATQALEERTIDFQEVQREWSTTGQPAEDTLRDALTQARRAQNHLTAEAQARRLEALLPAPVPTRGLGLGQGMGLGL